MVRPCPGWYVPFAVLLRSQFVERERKGIHQKTSKAHARTQARKHVRERAGVSCPTLTASGRHRTTYGRCLPSFNARHGDNSELHKLCTTS